MADRDTLVKGLGLLGDALTEFQEGGEEFRQFLLQVLKHFLGLFFDKSMPQGGMRGGGRGGPSERRMWSGRRQGEMSARRGKIVGKKEGASLLSTNSVIRLR